MAGGDQFSMDIVDRRACAVLFSVLSGEGKETEGCKEEDVFTNDNRMP